MEEYRTVKIDYREGQLSENGLRYWLSDVFEKFTEAGCHQFHAEPHLCLNDRYSSAHGHSLLFVASYRSDEVAKAADDVRKVKALHQHIQIHDNPFVVFV